MGVASTYNFRKALAGTTYGIVGRACLSVLRKFCDVDVKGEQNIPKEGPCMLIPKHQFLRDPFYFGLGLRSVPHVHPTYVMRPMMLFGSVLPTKFLGLWGAVMMYRPKDVRKASRQDGIGDRARLQNKYLVDYLNHEFSNNGFAVVFAEGERNPWEMGTLRRKFFDLAVEFEKESGKRVSFNPVGMRYSLPGDKRRISIRFGPPLYYDFTGIEGLMDGCYHEIKRLSGF